MSNKIIFEFDDKNDALELIKSLEVYIEISWFNNTKKAMIKVNKKSMKVIVSKSVYEPPKPLRL